MSIDQLLERLVTDLKPVRRRSVRGDTVIFVVLCGVELTLFLVLGAMRPDMDMAMALPSFWWKIGSMGVIAVAGAVVAIASFDPVRSPRRGLRWLAGLVAVCLVAGWIIDAASQGFPAFLGRLDWREGLACVYKMVLLSVPPVIGLGLLMRRGAPTDTGGTAAAVGIAAAGWGAFVFAFACPHDDPLYIAVWYTVGCGLVGLFARVVLPRLTRW